MAETLARHPFSSAGALGAALGVTARHARRLLEPLGDAVGKVCPRLPGLRLRLYYLRAPLAGTTPLRPQAAARYVYLAGTLHGLRGWLAGLPADFTWEELYPAPGRRGLIFHALLRKKDSPVAVVEWDTGLMPRSLFRYRLKRLLGIPTGSYTVSRSPTSTPPPPRLPLLVFTIPTRLDEIMRLVCRGRVPAAVAAIGEETTHTHTGTREAVCPWLNRLRDTDRSSQYPERLVSFAGNWTGETRRFLSLSAQEKYVLSLVVALPLVRPWELASLAGVNAVRAVRVLRGLERRGWVEAEDERYVPTLAGLSLMARTCSCTPEGYARARNYRLVSEDGRRRAWVPALRASPEHTAQERYLAAVLAQQLGPRWTWYDEREAVIPFHYYGSWRICPDALIAGDEVDVFLEVDRVSPQARIRRKLTRYYFYRSSSGRRPFLLLVVAKIPHRASLWLRAAREIAGERAVRRLPVLAALEADVRARGIRGRAWMGYDFRPRRLEEALGEHLRR